MAPSHSLFDSPQDSMNQPRGAVTRTEDGTDHESFWEHNSRPSASAASSPNPPHSRASSVDKSVHSSSAASSPRIAGGSSRLGLVAATDRPVDYAKTAIYGHHRQTSIVHGLQHSRNDSLSSMSSSPLSPQMKATAAGGQDRPDLPSVESRLELEAEQPPQQPETSFAAPASSPMGPLSMERSASAAETSSPGSAQRRSERIQGRPRREVPPQSSQSRAHRDEQKTVGEYALHVLFTSFIAQAEEKLSECITVPFEPEPQIERICGPGVDPAFDQLIIALGHIASPKPRALIDSMMLWRKSKSDAANEARSKLHHPRTNQPGGLLLRRNTEPVQPGPEPNSSGAAPFPSKQEYVAQQERRSTVSIYILCRVLLEVICQSSLACITLDMEDKLESIIFGQLKIADNEQLAASPLKLANWSLFAQLLGHMSGINFEGVSRRFIEDLEASLQEKFVRSPTSSAGRLDVEGKIELVLGGMKHLKVKISPEPAWERSCDFLVSIGRLLNKAHGPRVKSAFCQVINMLLLPIAAKASNSHLMHPKWTEVVAAIWERLTQLLEKQKHWLVAFPLMTTLLSVSSPENFSSRWLSVVLGLHTKIKDRVTRPICLQVISRLIWTYLYRTSDNSHLTVRKLDDVMKLALPTPKRSIVASDIAVTEPLIQIIRIIGFKYPEYCFRSVIFPLVNADLFTSNQDIKVEQLDPDRIVVGIRAFLCIMSDLEKGEQGRPAFPQFYDAPPSGERSSSSLIFAAPPEGLLSSPGTGPKVAIISRPVLTHVLSDGIRDSYLQFCKILGKIILVCDNTFGGQAALDEKFNGPGPRTPITDSFSFSRRDDHPNPSDQKQSFYELLHVAVQALPRCLSVDIPLNSLINLLCTGTAHVEHSIAESSANSLKAIARQAHAQQVTMGFARFIFNFDDRYSTMSDGGMLGQGHIENTLRLYVELLQIWIEELRHKSQSVANEPADAKEMTRALKLDLSSVWAEVDQAEAHGLFFLCSQSRKVRQFAITVLRLIADFDSALGKERSEDKENPRLIDILENNSAQVMNVNDEHLTVAERSRLHRGLQNANSKDAVLEVCTSEVTYDTTLWAKTFPNLIKISFEKCPFAVAICRDLICNRILQMYKPITVVSEPKRGLHYGSPDANSRVGGGQNLVAQPEIMVEQWKLYLIFACTTFADPGSIPSASAGDGQHARKASKPVSADEIVTARTLFKYLIPLLSVSSASVRDAVVVAMGSINIQIYRPLLEELQGQVSRCNDEARARIHQRTSSSPRRNRRMDLLRTEITHVFSLTSHFLKEPQVYQSDFFLSNLTSYAKDLKLFLMDGEVQMDWEFQKLRRHYCGLMEALFQGINKSDDPSRWMTFESRKSAFSLMEDWCGFSPNQNQIRAREDNMRQSLIKQQLMGTERGTVTAAMEIEKRNLRTAALSAMAALCAGPMSITTESGVTLQFDVRRMLTWLEAIFHSGSDKMNVIGRRALQNLVLHNQAYPYLLEHCIARCYLSDVPKVLESYFTVTIKVLQQLPNSPCPFWKPLALCLFTLGNEQKDIRSKSSAVLRSLETRQQRNSRIQDFDISVSDKTQAVYKLAQFEISKRLSQQYPELAFHVFSEFTFYFRDLQPTAQRNMVAVILPWVQTMELKLDPNGGPTAQSHVVLANLFELTIKSSGALHNEVQALWQALATGPHAGNVRLILDFTIQLCLECREQNFVEYAKQIVVFLSTTNSTPGIKVVEFLLMQINPKAMVPNEKRRESIPPPPDVNHFPYCAALSEALPVGTKQAGFSLGQLSLILLVDLMVSPVHLKADDVPLLLQVVTVLWDHYTPLVQEQAREMLVHMIHELVISRMEDVSDGVTKESIEDLVDAIRRHDRSVVWAYEDSNGKVDDRDNKVPPSMEFLTTEIVKTFQVTFPTIKEQWAKLSLAWATSCPVRHLACRSFQIFRCILTSIDQVMLGDMLARLSNTVADEDPEIQSFAMEILTTLKTLLVKLDSEKLLGFPQLFWTTCACLESINEREFLEATEMLNELVSKLDFRSPNVRRIIADGQPEQWDARFDGVQPLLYKGLRSSLCWQSTLDMMDKLVKLPNDALIGDDGRFLIAILANFPRFLNELENGSIAEGTMRTAKLLLSEADRLGLESIGLALDDLVSGKQQDNGDFLNQLFLALREHFLPQHEFSTVTFLIGLLTNSLSWVKVQTMRILCTAIPQVNMHNPELAGHGSDLISPLLRLLQTEFCMGALEVLDNIMTMSGSHMDKHHLRMSMTRSSSKATRKEYERTQSLFGIPETSGWAIPSPASKTESTRANIHAVFYTCQSTEGSAADVTPSSEVEFHEDDFPYGYFDMGERTETMLSSDDARGEGALGDLVTKLDSLDDFFDDASSPTTDDDGRSSRTITEFSPESFGSATELYDEQILPILHEASSTTAFQNGFADRPIAMPRDMAASNMMNPGAFTAGMPARPSLHSRSITSPSAPASYSPNMSGEVGSDEEYLSGGFSDADDERPHARAVVQSPTRAPRPALKAFPSRTREDSLREPTIPNIRPRHTNQPFQPSPRSPGHAP